MSTYVVDWALTQAPTANTIEYAILVTMAGRADRDGCTVFLSIPNLAKASHLSERSIQRHLQDMADRGLIAEGDPTAPNAVKWAKIRADNRPNLYDVLVPVTWYSADMLAKINDDREMTGREPLTSENRPPIRPAPPKKARADKGKPRPKRSKGQPTPDATAQPADATALPAETVTGGLVVTPCDDPEPAPEPDSRGDYESPRGVTTSQVAGCLVVTQTCEGNLSEEPVNAGEAMRRPPHTPQRTQTADDFENGVTAQPGFSTELTTARAEVQHRPTTNAETGQESAGEVGSARDAVMAEVRGRYPSKVRSRVAPKPSKRPSKPSADRSGPTSLAG